ncbi:MAG: hydroxymethylglutaryl-CoA reductase, degradative [Thaumarchaeota archaeon]|nr:hydroxymethylglutaryl-CoA reductase, degradative [Nitrososphaerota archaeon]
MKSSRIPGFYKLGVDERLKLVKEFSGLTEEEVELLKSMSALSIERADKMIENVIGGITYPLGIATNFMINGRDYLIPMAIEEPSVVAAASKGAKIAREGGGFRAWADEPVMIGQVQVVGLKDAWRGKVEVLKLKEEILKKANEQSKTLPKLGGGAKDLRVKLLETRRGEMLVVELLIDVRDAMGANVVNSMAEAVAPMIERATGGRALLRILSNLSDLRMARAYAVFPKELVGEEVIQGILDAYEFARCDPYRCATHNKGIMNGIVAVAMATGQDTRALEAGAHAYASLGGYKPLTRWEVNSEGDLVGSIELPLAVGIVGGSIRANPIAEICLKILGVKSSRELAEVMASVGLAQNFSALRALVSEGIQRGHMKLHARNLAVSAGAKGELIDRIAERMVEEGRVSFSRAKELLEELSEKTF